MPTSGDVVARALVFACEKHAGQLRKGTEIPYVSHPVTVAAFVANAGGSPDQIAAGLLHDTVEDCGGLPVLEQIRESFGDAVARIVDGCSYLPAPGDESWRQQKQNYIDQLRTLPPQAALVAVCDKLHNAMSVRADYQRCGEELWKRFRSGREGALWYYGAIRDLFGAGCDAAPARELAAVVADIEEAASGGAGGRGDRGGPAADGIPAETGDWRLRPSTAKTAIVEAVRRRAEDGGREEQIVMAYLLASRQTLSEDLERADDWLARAHAQELRGQIVGP